MMQLICNGIRLDLPSGAGLQFTHDNPLFAFDNLKCERTTNFKLPRTKTNDEVFALARIPAYNGEGMRRKFDAQLQDGVVVMNGYLYVDSWDGSDYNAIFVTGELVGLQRIKDLGKIEDIMSYTDVVQIGVDGKNGYAARQADERWANVYYSKQSTALFKPSMWLAKIYNDIITQEGITAQAVPVPCEKLWLISQAKGINQMVDFNVEIVDDTQPSGSQPTYPYNSATSDVTIFETEATEYGITVNATDGDANQWFNVVQFKAKTDIVLEIPDNWPSTLYIYDLSLTHDDGNGDHFYGDRWFETGDMFDPTTHIYPQGEELKGRGVSIHAGECFSFVDSSCYNYWSTMIFGQRYYNFGFYLQDSQEFASSRAINVKTDGDLHTGSLCRLQDNLPSITFIELLKTFAAVSGKVLNYDDVNGITFDNLDLDSWNVIELKNFTKKGEVKRTFADYGQQSIIKYASDETVATPITAAYTIDNDNIAKEKVLLTIPFNEGEQDINFPMWIYLRDGVNKETLGSDMDGSASLWRVVLPTNAGLQRLCTASTQLKIEANMTLMEYNAIVPKTILLVDNTKYVWTAKSWQKNIAKFTLAKV